MTRHISKEDIRAFILKNGAYDLSVRADQVRLRKRVDGTWRWLNSDLSSVDPSLRNLGPKKILERVSFKNRQMLAYNVKEILDRLRKFETVYFFGPGALTAAIAFGVQWCYAKPTSARYLTIADIATEKTFEPKTIGTARGDLLVLNLEPDAEGKIWAQEQARFYAMLRTHVGPTILVLREERATPHGQLCQLALECKKPSGKYPIGLKR